VNPDPISSASTRRELVEVDTMTHSGIRSALYLALCIFAPATGEAQTPLGGGATVRAEAPTSRPRPAVAPSGSSRGASQPLEARGPGAVFASIEAAAIDALTYAYLQALAAGEAELMRGGAIRTSGAGYSYGEIHVAKPHRAHRIAYSLEPRDVARFAIYPRDSDHDVNRANERPSRVDRRCVSTIDPLHRPLYILHPSLAIRAYRGEGHELVEVANLRRPARGLRLLAGN
jgi:hypothetical protein